jgi:hypothetical protein
MTLISPKILKLAQPSISNPIKILVNKSIESSIFLKILKLHRYPHFLKRITLLIKETTDL